ncbi:DUF1320 domain-containing protein [Pasteurella multocida]|uniref:gp436 family protein n=1 Tax=Pasteurella multocida TaxID=747 RepID=UPI002B69E480|nr:DUF1320 domain-containing protein [Pasteurella multocida]MEB3470154.1 DUF1320 domain-containing protein [Pasteurella multocida]
MVMPYISLPQLADKPGAVELAQVTAQSGQMPVAFELLEQALQGKSVDTLPQAQQIPIQKALDRIYEAITDACAVIDGFLKQRGYVLPFKKTPTVLTAWARAITRYYLHQHLISDEKNNPIVRDYRDAMKMLQLVAEGKFSLGADDTLASFSPKAKRIDRIFTQQTLKDY